MFYVVVTSFQTARDHEAFVFSCISLFLLNLIIKCVPYSAEISHLAAGRTEGISLLVSDWLSQLSLR